MSEANVELVITVHDYFPVLNGPMISVEGLRELEDESFFVPEGTYAVATEDYHPQPWSQPDATPLRDIQEFRAACARQSLFYANSLISDNIRRAAEALRSQDYDDFWSPDMSSTPDAAFYGQPMKLGRTLEESRAEPSLRFQRRITRAGEFGHRLPCWMDEVWEFTRAVVPPPIRGGTYFYCPWNETVRETAGGRVTHWACGVLHVGWATGTRFRTEKAYRRHYRRDHLS